VANLDNIADSAGKPQVCRHTYTPPAIKEFGPVSALTQSGSGMAVEMTMNNPEMSCSPNPNASMC
jgi:hypothetical protein